MSRLKICGIMSERDAGYVNEVLPEWGGFIIDFPKSHRSLAPQRVREVAALVDPRVRRVGVFVDADPGLIRELFEDGTIQVAQLHGDETEEYIRTLRRTAPGLEVWKAFRVRGEGDVRAAMDSSADLVVLDSGQGSGKRFDWHLLQGAHRPYLLAGGLTPENMGDVAATLSPYGLDISSGVETDGRKDLGKMRAAVEAARKGDGEGE